LVAPLVAFGFASTAAKAFGLKFSQAVLLRARLINKELCRLLAQSGHRLVHCKCLLSGVKRTRPIAAHMSAYDRTQSGHSPRARSSAVKSALLLAASLFAPNRALGRAKVSVSRTSCAVLGTIFCTRLFVFFLGTLCEDRRRKCDKRDNAENGGQSSHLTALLIRVRAYPFSGIDERRWRLMSAIDAVDGSSTGT
jgi:hypothetical protein